jgi:WXG100 family type VII secretion target
VDNFTDGNIYVDYAHMGNAADDMVYQTKAIDQTLTDLDAELQALRTSWIGSDSAAYDKQQEKWNNAVLEMERLLERHSHLLTEISDDYKWTENSLTQMWSEVKVIG